MVITARDVTSILLHLVTIFSIIRGICMVNDYVKKMEERQYDAIFSFYSRLQMYLIDFRKRVGLDNKKSVLLLLYKPDVRKGTTDIIVPEEKEIDEFRAFVTEFISFLKNSENQVPLTKKIWNTFHDLRITLVNLLHLGEEYSYATSYDDNTSVATEHRNILSIIKTLLDEIKESQNKIVYNLKI